MDDLAITHRGPSELRPYPGNARTHSKRQIKLIARSIERFGWTNPVLVSDDNEVVCGHGRLEAAKLLGLDRVPVVQLSNLSAAERRAYVIADNAIALKAGWDSDMLAIELQGLVATRGEASPVEGVAPQADGSAEPTDEGSGG